MLSAATLPACVTAVTCMQAAERHEEEQEAESDDGEFNNVTTVLSLLEMCPV
jgi:hypothetical protein